MMMSCCLLTCCCVCCRWQRELSRVSNTTPWSAEEDATIKKYRGNPAAGAGAAGDGQEGGSSASGDISSRRRKRWVDMLPLLPGRSIDAIKQRCEELGNGVEKHIPRRWTEQEMEILQTAVQRAQQQMQMLRGRGGRSRNAISKPEWEAIAQLLPGKTWLQCQYKHTHSGRKPQIA